MSQQRGGIAPRKKTILDHPKFKLSGPLNADGKRATFHPYLHINGNDASKNAPRIVVYTNLEADKQSKQDQIQGELGLSDFMTFVDAIRDAADPRVEFKQEIIELRNYIWMNGQRSEEVKTKAYLIVGRKDDGVVYVSLKHFDPRRGAIQFDFGYNEYVRLVRNEGPMEPCVASRRVARAMADLWGSYMKDEYRENTTLPEPRQQQGFGGNNQGGFQKQNNWNNNGGNNQGNRYPNNQGGGYDSSTDSLIDDSLGF